MTAIPGNFVARIPNGGAGTPPRGARLANGALLAKSGTNPLAVRTGVLADGGGPVVTGTSGMSYKVRAFAGAVGQTSTLTNGPTVTPNDAEVTVSTDPAPGANSRIDVIYIWQRLLEGDGGSESTNQPVIAVAKGQVSATPTAPSIPDGAVELARATVTAGTQATSGLTITQGQTTTANTGNRDTTSGLLWGTAYNPAVHTMKTHRVTVSGSTSSGSGDINLVADLTTLFRGVDSIVASNGRMDASIVLATSTLGNVAYARCTASNTGAPLLNYPLQVSAVITGWV